MQRSLELVVLMAPRDRNRAEVYLELSPKIGPTLPFAQPVASLSLRRQGAGDRPALRDRDCFVVRDGPLAGTSRHVAGLFSSSIILRYKYD